MSVKPPIVIDIGTSTTKLGFAGQKEPRLIPSLVGKLKIDSSSNQHLPNFLAGRRALAGIGSAAWADYEYSWPIEGHRIRDWDDLEILWRYMLHQKIDVNIEEYPLIISDKPLSTKQNKEMFTEMMFEKFNVPLLYIGLQSALSLYSAGQTSGLVIDSGAKETYSVPIYQGFPIKHAVERLSVAGFDVHDSLSHLLRKRFYQEKISPQVVNEIKERFCFIRHNESGQNFASKDYTLPDGRRIILDKELYQAPEVLFDPYLNGHDLPGLHEFIFRSLNKLNDEGLRNHLSENMLLAGANTLLPGFAQRVKYEVSKLIVTRSSSGSFSQRTAISNNKNMVSIITPDDRKYSSWIGGSILGLVSNFKAMCLSKSEYQELGSSRAIFKFA